MLMFRSAASGWMHRRRQWVAALPRAETTLRMQGQRYFDSSLRLGLAGLTGSALTSVEILKAA